MLELVRTISRVGFACALVMLLAACSGSYAGMNSCLLYTSDAADE